MKQSVWVLEDDAGAQFVYEELLSEKYDVKIFETVAEYLHEYNTQPRPNLLIADLRLSDGVFTDHLHSMVRPCMVVSSLDDIEILRICFAEGITDYLTKPFAKSEFMVKVENMVDLASLPADIGPGRHATDLLPFEIDATNLLVTRNHHQIKLTPREMQILTHLSKPPFVFSRQQIIAKVWMGHDVSAKTLDVHLFNLRKKLNKLDLEIQNIGLSQFSLVI